jgi:hypothetical protein
MQGALFFENFQFPVKMAATLSLLTGDSIEVNRRKRRSKTDRIDVQKLMHMLLRYHGGEQLVWSVVN